MKKSILLLSLLSIFINESVLSQASIERALGEFSGVLIEQNIQAELFKGESNKVELTIDGIKEDKVLSEITDGKLSLGFKSTKNLEGVTVSAKIYCTGKIANIEVLSSSSMDVKNVAMAASLVIRVTEASSMQINTNTTDLKVNVSGNSNLNITAKAKNATVSIGGASKVQMEIETTSLDATVAGKGRLDITGKAESLKVNSNSSAKYMGYGLTSKTLIAQSHGNGRAEVTVTDSIFANVVSGGKIYYKGNPADVKVNATGSGLCEKAED